LGYVNGGGELQIDPMKMEAIVKKKNPTNVIGIRIFLGETCHLRNFIASF
jgi:hypothetical protein